MLINMLGRVIGGLSTMAKIPEDLVRLVLGMLINIAVAFYLKNIQSPKGRLWLCLLGGIMVQMFIFADKTVYSALNLLISYCLLRFLPRKIVGWGVTIFVIISLSLAHITRMIIDYEGWKVTIVTVLMIQTIFISTFAWDYQEGQNETPSPSAIRTIPSLFEYCSAGFCFTQCLAGPTSNFMDFINYIYRKEQYAKIAPTFWASMSRLGHGILCIIVHTVIQKIFPISGLYSDTYWFSSYNPLKRAIYLIFASIIIKSKYYVGFTLSEAATIASGQAFAGYDNTGKAKYDKMYTIGIQVIELSVFGRRHVQEWNHQVHIWIKKYIYSHMRESQYLKKYAFNLSFMVSAVWHGFYPIYFISMLFYSVGTMNCTLLLRFFLKYSFLRNPLGYAFCFLFTYLSMAYFSSMFFILFLDRIIAFHNGLLWFSVLHGVMYLLSFALDKYLPTPTPGSFVDLQIHNIFTYKYQANSEAKKLSNKIQ